MKIGSVDVAIVRKDIKNLHISVMPPNGEVRVSAPFDVSDDRIRIAVASRLAWIRKHQNIYNSQERIGVREIVSGESHYLWGERYLMQVVNGIGGVVIKHNKMILSVRDSKNFESKKRVLEKFYRDELIVKIEKMLEIWEAKIGVKSSSVKILKMKTKWGSYNIKDGNIIINYELAKKPLECLEYIIVHELVHMLERHHNKKFIAYMDKFLPNWRTVKSILNALPLENIK
ncbi:M48 family metallopeptidase [Campylobacter sp. MOP51]|uniref:M48 family metallopeptidase n=1 Tax=Campylobacter canis TaxID=3378588 RepID=UPI003C4E7EB8